MAMSEYRLYLDYAALSYCVDWDDIVCQGIDDLADAESHFYGIERRYYYVGSDPERGELWTSES